MIMLWIVFRISLVILHLETKVGSNLDFVKTIGIFLKGRY